MVGVLVGCANCADVSQMPCAVQDNSPGSSFTDNSGGEITAGANVTCESFASAVTKSTATSAQADAAAEFTKSLCAVNGKEDGVKLKQHIDKMAEAIADVRCAHASPLQPDLPHSKVSVV